MVFLGGACALGGVDGLDVVALGQCALVAAQPALGELVHALVGRRSSRLDHVQYASLVRTQSGDLADDPADHLRALAQFLRHQKKRR